MEKMRKTRLSNLRLAAVSTIAATGLASGATAAEHIVIDGRVVNVGQAITQTRWNDNSEDQHVYELTYGGPGTFDRIRPVLSIDEVSFRTRAIAAAQLQTDIKNVTVDTPIDLWGDDCIVWRDIIREVMATLVDENGYDIYKIFDQLSMKENPKLNDLVEIVNELQDKKIR